MGKGLQAQTQHVSPCQSTQVYFTFRLKYFPTASDTQITVVTIKVCKTLQTTLANKPYGSGLLMVLGFPVNNLMVQELTFPCPDSIHYFLNASLTVLANTYQTHTVFEDLHYIIHSTKMHNREWERSLKLHHHLLQAVINLSWDLVAKGIQKGLAVVFQCYDY